MKSIYRKHIYPTTLLFIVLMLPIPNHLSAQYGWSNDPADYKNSCDITGIVYLDGVFMTDGALGAFVNDTCRGFDDLAESGPDGFLGFQFLVYSNASYGETLSFRYYNEQNGKVYDVLETVEFSTDVVYGNARDPLVFNAYSDDPGVVSVSVAGSILTITEAGMGSATVTVTADDGLLKYRVAIPKKMDLVHSYCQYLTFLSDFSYTKSPFFLTN